MSSFSFADQKTRPPRKCLSFRMKGEPLAKPPPLLLPGKNHIRNLHDRAHNRFTAKYDNFSGIVKRVSEMKLGMDTDETMTESGKSESSSEVTRSSRSSGVPYSSGEDDSSVTGSDLSPPYEELPLPNNRYSYTSLPSPPHLGSLRSFRDSLPDPPSPTTLYSNESAFVSRRKSSSSSTIYSNTDNNRQRPARPSSLYSNCEQTYNNTRSPLYSNGDTVSVTDVNENETIEERLKEGITEKEIHKIELFFRGLRTDIWVCSCLANMYVSQKGQDGQWTLRHTGVPVLLLETAGTRSRSKNRIEIIMAERGTSFPLWRDTIDHLTSYRKSSQAFHTMHLSSDHRQVIGISFDSEAESERILAQIETLTANPENINISVPKKKKKSIKIKKPAPLPHKKDISNPCLFEHVTSVNARDKPVYMSMKTLIASGMINKSENIS